jgi:hypothetical protein
MKTTMIKALWESNIFFWKESRTFIAPWKLKDYLYAPIAWWKFMSFLYKTIKD